MGRASALLQRLQRRDLYRFVGSVQLSPTPYGLPTPDARLLAGTPAALQAVAGEIAQMAHNLGATLSPEELIVDLRRVSYGCRGDNPLQRIRWYDARQAEVPLALGGEGTYLRARRLPVETRAATPRAFEEVSLRVFLTASDGGGLDGARAAFRLWSERNEVCDEIDVTHLGPLWLDDTAGCVVDDTAGAGSTEARREGSARGADFGAVSGDSGDTTPSASDSQIEGAWALTVPQLKARLRAAGKRVGGNKAELIERLIPSGPKDEVMQ